MARIRLLIIMHIGLGRSPYPLINEFSTPTLADYDLLSVVSYDLRSYN